MNIALSTDHAGLEKLQKIAVYLDGKGHTCQNFGPGSFDAQDDYPDFIFPAAEAVASGEFEAGIILGGSGQGEAMAANRVAGVRCTVFYQPATAVEAIDAEGNMSQDPFEILKLSRQHNHANMLSLASRFLTIDLMKQAIDAWIETPYSQEERHARRVEKLDQ
jgi:ribose 5-phosphate isomerase B